MSDLYWSTDAGAPQATAALMALYLRARDVPKAGPEFLLRDPASDTWYVRWPNGRVGWESAVSLAARHIAYPTEPVIVPGLERRLLAELQSRETRVGAE